MKKWKASNTENAEYLGIIEFRDNKEEFHNFEILKTETKLIFGGATNTGFLESGYMIMDDCFSLDENLQELLADLETYYNDGPEYVSLIVCNVRM